MIKVSQENNSCISQKHSGRRNHLAPFPYYNTKCMAIRLTCDMELAHTVSSDTSVSFIHSLYIRLSQHFSQAGEIFTYTRERWGKKNVRTRIHIASRST